MADELFYRRRQQLIEVVRKAVQDLLALESMQPAAFDFSLDEKMTVTILERFRSGQPVRLAVRRVVRLRSP